MRTPTDRELLALPGEAVYKADIWSSREELGSCHNRSYSVVRVDSGVYPDICFKVTSRGVSGHNTAEMLATRKAYMQGDLRKYARWRKVSNLVAVNYEDYVSVKMLDLCTGEKTTYTRDSVPYYGIFNAMHWAGQSSLRNLASHLRVYCELNKDKAPEVYASILPDGKYKPVSDKGMDWYAIQTDVENSKLDADILLERMRAVDGMKDVELHTLELNSTTESLFHRAAKVVPVMWIKATDLFRDPSILDKLVGEDNVPRLIEETLDAFAENRERYDAHNLTHAIEEADDIVVCIYKIETKEV